MTKTRKIVLFAIAFLVADALLFGFFIGYKFLTTNKPADPIVAHTQACARAYHVSAFSKAEAQCQLALEAAESRYGHESPELIESLFKLGLVQMELKAYDKAEPTFQRALDLAQKNQWPSRKTLWIRNNLALIYENQKRYDKAEALYLELIEEVQTLHPENRFLVGFYNNLGELYRHQKRFDQAQAHYDKAFKMAEKLLPENAPDIAVVLASQGELYRDQGDLKQARFYLQKALTLARELFGENHPRTREFQALLDDLPETKKAS